MFDFLTYSDIVYSFAGVYAIVFFTLARFHSMIPEVCPLATTSQQHNMSSLAS